MPRRFTFALLIALLVCLPARAQDYKMAPAAATRAASTTSINELRAQAEKGDAHSQFMVGALHASGEGVPRDYAKAASWYRKAAEQGLPEAENNLGLMYDKGQGVAQDHKEAVTWYRMAAEQGYAPAQNNLAAMYADGRGVTQNYAKAKKWFSRAARQGSAQARRNLGLLRTKPRRMATKRPPSKAPPRKPASAGSPAGKQQPVAEQRAAPSKPKNTIIASKQPRKEHKVPEKSGTSTAVTKDIPQASKTEKPGKEAKAASPVAAGFFVQLGSRKTEDRALAEGLAASMTKTHKPILGDLEIAAVRADLGGRGIYYRFRAGPLAKHDAAAALCSKLSARNQACFVTQR